MNHNDWHTVWLVITVVMAALYGLVTPGYFAHWFWVGILYAVSTYHLGRYSQMRRERERDDKSPMDR